MIDTVGFYIPVSNEDYKKLIGTGIMTQRIDRDTGFVEFEYTNFRVDHSYNYKVQWKVDNKHIVRDPGLKRMVQTEGIPYLRFEFSAPKILFGHNLYSVDVEGMLDACLIVKNSFEKLSGVELPGPGWWYPYRIDTCANFILDDISQVKSYIRYAQRLDYPRRKGNIYKDTGLYFASTHNTLKMYCKGEEFRKHDAERFLNEVTRQQLQKQADKILRIEVENKRRIKFLIEKHEAEYNETFEKFKGWVSLEDLLYIVQLNDETKHVISKFLAGTETKVMQSLDVLDILCTVKGIRSPKSYYGIYMLIVTQGQNEAKRRIPKRTYYKALRIFRENGISLIASDKNETGYFLDRGFPADFTLDRNEENKYYQQPLSELKYHSDGTAEPL
jgi:II/X family phage/plasmid replication protein